MVVKKLTLIFLIELNMVISPSQREVVYKVRNAYKVLVYKVRNAYKVLVYKVRNAYKVLVYKVRNAYKVYWVVKRINAQMREQSHNTVLQGLYL